MDPTVIDTSGIVTRQLRGCRFLPNEVYSLVVYIEGPTSRLGDSVFRFYEKSAKPQATGFVTAPVRINVEPSNYFQEAPVIKDGTVADLRFSVSIPGAVFVRVVSTTDARKMHGHTDTCRHTDAQK